MDGLTCDDTCSALARNRVVRSGAVGQDHRVEVGSSAVYPSFGDAAHSKEVVDDLAWP